MQIATAPAVFKKGQQVQLLVQNPFCYDLETWYCRAVQVGTNDCLLTKHKSGSYNPNTEMVIISPDLTFSKQGFMLPEE